LKILLERLKHNLLYTPPPPYHQWYLTTAIPLHYIVLSAYAKPYTDRHGTGGSGLTAPPQLLFFLLSVGFGCAVSFPKELKF
jgi:hypothetical protein